MKNLIPLLVIVLIIIAFSKKESWLGFYYPNGCLSCESDYIFSPEFDSKEQCFAWANDIKRRRDNPEDLFECGLNCKKDDYGMYICKETVD